MASLNELSRELKEFICSSNSDAHNRSGFDKNRYNNLKIDISNSGSDKAIFLKISVGMSEAVFNVSTSEKISGGLGPDERYVYNWIKRDSVIAKLQNIYKAESKLGSH